MSWVPGRFLIEESRATPLNQYPRSALVITLLVGLVLDDFVGPVVEELLFTGGICCRGRPAWEMGASY
jgi:hypothetical protein